jgi:hypothetical protein
MPYKEAERQLAYLKAWRRRRTLDALHPAERALIEEAERLIEASLRVNTDFVRLRKTVQDLIILVKKLLEVR